MFPLLQKEQERVQETKRLLDAAVAARQQVIKFDCEHRRPPTFSDSTDTVHVNIQAEGELERTRQACEQRGREQDDARRIAEKEADETRAKLAEEREAAAQLREKFRMVEAEKARGGVRRAPKRLCNQTEKAQPRPPLTVSVCVCVCCCCKFCLT